MTRLEKGKEMAFLGSRVKLSPSSVPLMGRDQRQELEIQPHGLYSSPQKLDLE